METETVAPPKRRTWREIWATIQENYRRYHPWLYEPYVSKLTPTAFVDGTLTLAAPAEDVRFYVENRLDRVLRIELKLETGKAINLAYVVSTEAAPSC